MNGFLNKQLTPCTLLWKSLMESVPIDGTRICLMKDMSLQNMLYIPNFKCNFLSVSWLTKEQNCIVTFLPNFCVIQDLPTKIMIGVGNGLYHFQVAMDMVVLLTSTLDSFKRWHYCLGHILTEIMRDISVISCQSSSYMFFDYELYILAKHPRRPFPISSIKIAACYECIHYDI